MLAGAPGCCAFAVVGWVPANRSALRVRSVMEEMDVGGQKTLQQGPALGASEIPDAPWMP